MATGRELDRGSPDRRGALATRAIETTDLADEHVVLLGQLIGDGSYLRGQPLRYTTSSEENSAAVARAAEACFGTVVRRYAGRVAGTSSF
jgi:replicative DNA helicase